MKNEEFLKMRQGSVFKCMQEICFMIDGASVFVLSDWRGVCVEKSYTFHGPEELLIP